MMTNTAQFADLMASVEAVMGQSFEGASFSTMAQAVRDRVAELEAPAAQEAEFDASSLELGILKGLMAEIAKMGDSANAYPTSLQVH